MIFGGGNPATATTEIIDLVRVAAAVAVRAVDVAAAHRDERDDPAERQSAGAGRIDERRGRRNREPECRPVRSGHEHVLAGRSERVPAPLPFGSLLLPDATVLLVGGNPSAALTKRASEIYSPAYLFNADGSAAMRPAINSVSPAAIGYGSTFQVQTPDAANITSVVLVRPGAQTHAFDMDQRLVRLSYTAAGGVLNVTAPPNGNIAPPGYYMLFILNSAGVPSVATFVQRRPPRPRTRRRPRRSSARPRT